MLMPKSFRKLNPTSIFGNTTSGWRLKSQGGGHGEADAVITAVWDICNIILCTFWSQHETHCCVYWPEHPDRPHDSHTLLSTKWRMTVCEECRLICPLFNFSSVIFSISFLKAFLITFPSSEQKGPKGEKNGYDSFAKKVQNLYFNGNFNNLILSISRKLQELQDALHVSVTFNFLSIKNLLPFKGKFEWLLKGYK